jgi:hypothetical protein
MQSRDTEYWAEELQFEYWRSLEPIERVELFDRVCQSTRELHLQGLRELHPNASEEELRLRSAALSLGRDVVLQLTGFDVGAD